MDTFIEMVIRRGISGNGLLGGEKIALMANSLSEVARIMI